MEHPVRTLSIKSKQPLYVLVNERVRATDLSHKHLAIGGIAVFVSIIVVAAFLATSYTALNSLQAINPVAALTAITVAIIGFAWFNKSKK